MTKEDVLPASGGRVAEEAGAETARPLTVYRVFWLFLIAGVVGDLIEVVFWLVTRGELISRSSLLYGPFSLVWGLAAVLLTLVFHRMDDQSAGKIFAVGTVLGGVYEYICSWVQEALFGACHEYFQRTGRRISFEYAMIDGVNDHDWQADLIAKKLRGMPGHVNLIPLNDVAESPLKPSRRVRQFQQRLERQGITATVRRSLGGDIDASCGQLRRKAMEKGREEQGV